ncbi:hypothetical protein I302_104441 [Kwoniella bestiolae CBS 10118]|uniref:Uncharacterized protein n=1 Tax=Kwoniella bestiolae CBS 10118 TaxID=1296100 RepID=A0AAJ8K7H3_9TREE
MARSLDVFNQRHKSGAPTLMISSSTREDLPQLNRSADAITRRRRAHSSESDQKDFIASPWPSDDHNQSTHTDGRSDTLNSTMDERDIEEILDNQKSTNHPSADDTEDHADAGTISARDIEINEVQPLRDMKIATLRRSLGRVLFSPGPLPLRDSRTGVWNFDPSLHDIPQPDKFAFHRCPPYITPSQDRELVDLAEQHRCRFVGSTSTLTKALSQIYFAISGGKGVDLSTLSQDFSSEVSCDKRWDVENVISDFGRILEKMLTCETSDFKRFLLSSPESAVSEDERTEKEAYRYQRTRACLPVRHDRANYQANSVYDIWKDRGYTQSYEREYYDLLRAGMLKFSLQVRIGGMDGIFLAYHNTSRLFGFQYISLSEIDERIFGSTEMAEQAFRLSVSLLEVLLQKAVAEFPDQAINILLKHSPSVHAHSVTAYVEPKHWDGPKGDRPIRAITLTMKNILDDEAMHGPVTFSVDEKVRQSQNWSVHYIVSYNNVDEEGLQKARRGLHRLQQDLLAMNHLTVPAGQTVKSMMQKDNIARRRERKARQDEQQTADVTDESLNNVEHDQPYPKIKWREPGARQIQLREEAQESGQAYERRKKTWKKGRYAWTVHTHSIPSII